MSTTLDLATHELTNGHTIEASAGTGKTYSVAALVTRAIAVDDDLRIDKVLITTFTRYAAAELRDRVRRRLAQTADKLELGEADLRDPILTALLADAPNRGRYIRNLRRAAVNFDNATIGTIHSVCSRILAMAGLVGHDDSAEEIKRRVVAEVVNDRLVSEAVRNDRTLNEAAVKKALEARLANPLAEMWFDKNLDAAVIAEVRDIENLLNELVAEVNALTEMHPSFDDLVRRAELALSGEMGDEIRAKFAERYTHAFIDEAQDTDELQWRLFHHIFPKANKASTHKLTAVGDPKQAIYGFRGADINAYLAARDTTNMSTLDTNFRSDPPVIDALNALFAGASLGAGIDYSAVLADPEKSGSKVRGVHPVETIDLVDKNNQDDVADAASGHVFRLLEQGRIIEEETSRPIAPRDICVLAGTNGLVRAIHRRLQGLGIPAVASGAESVFADTTATEIRLLLEALERVNSPGRVRNVATTSFFGFGLGDPRLLPDDMVQRGADDEDPVLAIQEKLVGWRNILQRRGVAALAAAISSDADVMEAFVAGPDGERHLADFSHIIDLLHGETHGRGVTPTEALEAFDGYAAFSGSSDVVSRRIESDSDAVQVMTIHKAKGLQFPCVIVADLWKPSVYEEHRDIPKYTRIMDDGSEQSVIDVGWVLGHTADSSKALVTQAQCEEQKRLIYVAFTRPEYHLAFVWQSRPPQPSMLAATVDLGVIGRADDDGNLLVDEACITVAPRGWRYVITGGTTDPDLVVAEGPDEIEQTYRRTSFTGITRAQNMNTRRVGAPEFEASAGGNDEDTNWFAVPSYYADAETPTGLPMPLGRIPGGKHVGTALHAVYEHIDTAATDLRGEIDAKCRRLITGSLLGGDLGSIIDGVDLSMATPLGPLLGNTTLADIPPERRLAELKFEMSIAKLAAGVLVSDCGRILAGLVPDDDVLRPYVDTLTHESFDIPLAGLINGSIDAVLQMGTDDDPALWITDYKSNRLDREGDPTLISAYRQDRLLEAMVHHHYPLQALIYGAAMYRFLRWRAPGLADPSGHVKGFSYFFIRGMVGPNTPADTGIFTWQAPAGLWQQLSDRLAGDDQ